MPPVAKLFVGFFLVSTVLLLLIAMANLPVLFRAVRHHYRLFRARRSRHERMLADDRKLERDAAMLQGLCFAGDAGEEITKVGRPPSATVLDRRRA